MGLLESFGVGLYKTLEGVFSLGIIPLMDYLDDKRIEKRTVWVNSHDTHDYTMRVRDTKVKHIRKAGESEYATGYFVPDDIPFPRSTDTMITVPYQNAWAMWEENGEKWPDSVELADMLNQGIRDFQNRDANQKINTSGLSDDAYVDTEIYGYND